MLMALMIIGRQPILGGTTQQKVGEEKENKRVNRLSRDRTRCLRWKVK